MKKSYGSDKKVQMEKDFYKQLKGQEDGINSMTVSEYLNNRAEIARLTDKHGSWKKARDVMTNNGTVQNNARDELSEYIKKSAAESLENKNDYLPKSKQLTVDEIKSKSIKTSSDQLKKLDALHEQDLHAGGYDKIQALYNDEGEMIKSGLGNK